MTYVERLAEAIKADFEPEQNPDFDRSYAPLLAQRLRELGLQITAAMCEEPDCSARPHHLVYQSHDFGAA